MVTLTVRYVFFVPLFPITYPLVRLWDLVQPVSARMENGRTSGRDLEHVEQQEAQEGPSEPWYAPLILVQVVAGLMTEVSSIFFAVSTGNIVSIVSTAFGLYCLSVSTLVAVLEGPISTPRPLRQEHTSSELGGGLEQEISNDSGAQVWTILPLAIETRKIITIVSLLILAIGLGGGLLSMPFLGFYFLETGEKHTGSILASVGCFLWGLLLLFLLFSRSIPDVESLRADLVFLEIAAFLLGTAIVIEISGAFEAFWLWTTGGFLLYLSVGCIYHDVRNG